MCEWFDETCGELLDHLDKKNLREETLVIYVADNGWIQHPEKGRYAPKSKSSPYDGGIRTPVMLRWSGHIKPGKHDVLVTSLDIAPTVLSACGIKDRRDMPGMNLLDVIRGKAPKRDTIFGEIFKHDVYDIDKPAASLKYRWAIQRRWKLIVPADGKTDELYDLSADPHETKNLAATQPAVTTRLREKLDTWWKPRR